MVIVVWMSVPFVAFSVFAGLTQVSGEVLEAAQMDGAKGFQRLRYIILPMIRPVLGIVLLLQIIWDLRVFTQIKLLQDKGSIASETNLLGTYIYQLGVGSSDFAMASAVSVFVLVLTIAISWFYVRNLLKEDAVMTSRLTEATRVRTSTAGARRQPARKLRPQDQAVPGRPRHRRRRHLADLGVPRLLDGQLVAAAQRGAAEHDAHLAAVRRIVRQLRRGDQRRHLLPRARHEPHHRDRHRRVLHRVRLPRRARDQPVQVPRAQVVRAGRAAHPDAAGRGPVHRPVQADGQPRTS